METTTGKYTLEIAAKTYVHTLASCKFKTYSFPVHLLGFGVFKVCLGSHKNHN